MKNKKFLSVLLCLALLASLPVLPGGAAAADGSADNGMKISKTATANNDGTYTITLEAYATGSQVTTTVNKDIPTDIVLVIDQSGSMANDIGQVSFAQYKDEVYYWGTTYRTRNQDYYEYRHNGGSANLWHELNGSYVSVSVTKTTTYKELSTDLPNFRYSGECYWKYANNLYEKVGDEYKKVTLTRSGNTSSSRIYTYTFSNGDTVESKKDSDSPKLGSHAPLYTPAADGNNTVYTYTYTDSAGVVKIIGTSTGADTVYTPAFYQRTTSTSGGGSRLNALKSAANAFASAVAEKAKGKDGTAGTTDDVNHRIAVVGYADTDNDYGYNTGVFIGSTLNRYESAAAGVYGTALQNMSTTGGKNNVTASIDALKASGATRTDYGLIMAKGILDANSVPQGETRNRVVIVFTDGAPTDYSGFQKNVANSAISAANAIKAGGTTVYSIGIFSGADASTAGKEPDKDYDDGGWGGPNYTGAEMSAACNWFMQQVSSNNGTPRTPSYYLSAADAGTLNNIFQQISDQIQTGGSSSTLTSESVVKDIISPQFTLPDNATVNDITLETWKCTGKDANGEYTWSKNAGAMGATATITSTDDTHTTTTNNQVNVTGFNFSENWCGTETDAQGNNTVRGNKLVIKFNVKPRDGFLGGNGVYTNTSAGVYENASATEPVLPFDRPQTDVTIKEPTIALPDANVYLGAYFNETVNAEDLKKGTSITFGSGDSAVSLDLTQPDQNWGLEAWQTEYVNNIEVKVTDKEGNEVTDFAKLTDDTQYKVSVSITPKTPKEGNNGFEKSMTGTIHVFKPQLTFKDSTVEYRKTVVTGYEGNKVSEEWKSSDGKVDSEATMLTSKPALTLTYTPKAGSLDNTGLVISTEDIPVKVDVALNGSDEINGVPVTDYTTFVHQPCTPDCGWKDPATPGDPAFLLHVKDVYADLTIKKTGASVNPDGTGLDAGQSFLFTVTDPEGYSTEVIIVGNGSVTLKNLKIGTYTVREDTSWSWRYTPDKESKEITLKANEKNEVTINNTRDEDQWLDGNVRADNVFTGAAGR